MTFDDKLREVIDKVEVPDELKPENIAFLIKQQQVQSKMEIEHREIKSKSSSALRRSIVIRTAVGIAACAIFAFGMYSVGENGLGGKEIESPIKYQANSPNSYDDLYDMYTKIYLEDNSSDIENGLNETDEFIKKPLTDGLTDPDSIEFPNGDSFSTENADIIKFDEENLYCVKDGSLYIISLETMQVIAVTENKLNPPIEMYILEDKLILISKEDEEVQYIEKEDIDSADNYPSSSEAAYSDENSNSSSTENIDDSKINGTPTILGENDGEKLLKKNIVLDIYDISDPSNPTKHTTYKQNGEYISSKIVNGILYTVTSYNNYRIAPLAKNAEISTYVPSYSINGEVFYIAAEDIIVPSNANSIDYTVLSAVNLENEAEISIKAVLGDSENVYCSNDSLYIVGVGKDENEFYSIITSFGLSENGMNYKASGSVSGKLISDSISEYNGHLRIATTEINSDNAESVSVYVLDEFLTVINSAGGILPSTKIYAVNFDANFASFFDKNMRRNEVVLDLSQNPPKQTLNFSDSSSNYLQKYDENSLIAISQAEKGLNLSKYNSVSGELLNSIIFGETLENVTSIALTDRRALLINPELGFVGIPISSENEFGIENSYCVFEYNEEIGFTQVAAIEYNDLDESNVFERAYINNDTLYIIGGARVVSVRISDWKVIETLEY